jgi:hypothetical protein
MNVGEEAGVLERPLGRTRAWDPNSKGYLDHVRSPSHFVEVAQ